MSPLSPGTSAYLTAHFHLAKDLAHTSYAHRGQTPPSAPQSPNPRQHLAAHAVTFAEQYLHLVLRPFGLTTVRDDVHMNPSARLRLPKGGLVPAAGRAGT